MTYDEVLGRARGNMGPHCKACPVCNGSGCKNTIPGPGSKGLGTVFPRNYAAWQEIALNMDTICPMEPVDTELTLFGHSFSLPVFAAPIGAVRNHYGDKLTEAEYDAALVRGCREAGIAAFLGDGLADFLIATACHTIREQGFAVPTVKPWSRDLVFRKIDQAKEHGAQLLCMDIDASGLPFLKNMTPPSGTKSVAELKEIMDYAGIPFLLKGIMTVRGAEKAREAGAAGIIVSNHGGRVLDQVPATAKVLPAIAKAVGDSMTILVDGGIRTGLDVFKALALGADAVLIGRPFVTAVYGGGAEGVGVYAEKLATELRDTMEMCGVHRLSEINGDCIWNG